MSAHAIDARRRRGACPGLSAPMPTGDGLLVRLTPHGTVSLDAGAALCAAAQRHGNGIVEVTVRGNIQVRGLSAASAAAFATEIAALDIAAADGIPVLTNPLAGLDPEEIVDGGALAGKLRIALAQSAPRLGPKVSVIVDGGGALTLDAVAADVRLRATRVGGGIAFAVALAGDGADAVALGLIEPGEAIAAVRRLLDVVARHGRHARARDVVAQQGLAPFREALAACTPCPVNGIAHRPRSVVGRHRLRDGSLAYGIGLAFGHSDASKLQQLIDAARLAGASGLRTAPDRTVLIIGLGQQAIGAFVIAAEKLGFIVRADDPRRRVVACAGAPICAAAEIPARALAPAIAAAAAGELGGALKIHVSGCAKGCAHPSRAALTVVGTPNGCALVANGTAREAPLKIVPRDTLVRTVAELVRDINGGERHG